jgi:hypothetical protein
MFITCVLHCCDILGAPPRVQVIRPQQPVFMKMTSDDRETIVGRSASVGALVTRISRSIITLLLRVRVYMCVHLICFMLIELI